MSDDMDDFGNGGNILTPPPEMSREGRDFILEAAINRARSEYPWLAEHWAHVTPAVYREKRGINPKQLNVLASIVNKYIGR